MAGSRSVAGSRGVPGGKVSLEVTSPDFDEGHRIPKRHAHRPEGDDVPPTIEWGSAPEGTVEFALICDDPDAPRKQPWVHWVAFKIPKDVRSTDDRGEGSLSGRNDFGGVGWGGPLPPEGDPDHHYRFKVLALNAHVTLPAGATKDELLEAVLGHVLAEGELVGTYSRSR